MPIRHCLLPLLIVSCLAAEPIGPAPRKWMQIKGAFLRPDNCHCLENTEGVGAGAGTWFTDRWGAEVDYLDATLKSRRTGVSADEKHLMGSALFNLNPRGAQWFPYLRAGVGAARVGAPFSLEPGTTTRLTYHGGLGIQRFFSTHGIASAEARAVTIDTRVSRTEYQGLLGLGWRWGTPAAVAAPVPAPPVRTASPAPEVPAPVAEPAPVPAAAPTPPPLPAPGPTPEPPPAKVVLDDALLHFANDEATLPSQAVEAVRVVARGLKAYAGSYELTVTGHTSSRGGRVHNRELSRRRAEAVARVLVAEGIPAERVKAEGMGPDQPIADNATKEGQARNRRVEILVKAEGAEIRRNETAVQEPAPAAGRLKKTAKP